ncbi:FkbM family methyltransferase [Zavarzinia compransoris]|uniref:FkbM family methyltransferase n=1 Tax=Zavarzinia marina TaxID=2911065 RepID=UPI001EED2CF7|nr:FkbM family methyltransferase [Zavarzinia marina]MCF4166034.1 FkbM family methyltransferase [Zavarzinia marina]
MLAHLKSLIETRFPRAFALLADLRDGRAMKDGEAEMCLLREIVSAGETACDVGANRGLYSFWLLRLGARVFAFEPNPRLVRIMRLRFRRALAEGRLTVTACAASDRAGDAVLHVPSEASALATVENAAIARMDGTTAEDMNVPRARLDDLVREETVDFVKIDVEGHELAVVEGARTIIGRDLPTLLIEAEERHRPGAVASLRTALAPFGFEGFYFDQGRLHPIAGFDPPRHQNIGALNAAGTLKRPGTTYINNFLFVARPEVRARLGGRIVEG